jgi:hypothetical protein
MSRHTEGSARQRNLIIVLAVVLLISGWHFVGPMLGFGWNDAAHLLVAHPTVDSEGDAPSRPSHRIGAGHLGTHSGERVAVLHLADLDRIPSSSARGRDLWTFVNPLPPPIVHTLPLSNRQGPVAEAPLPKLTPPSPHPADFDLQYLGRFGPPDKQIAVFAKGKAILNKQEGEVIDNQFIVAHIGYEAVDIRFVGFPDLPAKRVGLTRRR